MEERTPVQPGDEGLAFLSDAFNRSAGWGCVCSAFGLLSVFAVPIFYLGGSLEERPIALVLAVVGFGLLWSGKLKFRRYFEELRAPRRMPGFLLDRTTVRAGPAVVTFEGGAPPVEGTGTIASFDEAKMVREDWGSDLRLILALAPLGDEKRLQLATISLARGDRELLTIAVAAGTRFWIARGAEALIFDPEEYDNARLFGALRWIAESLEAGVCGPLAVQIVIVVPREGVALSVAFGMLGAAVSTRMDARRVERIERYLAEGQLTDPESGEDIVGFAARAGWDLAVT